MFGMSLLLVAFARGAVYRGANEHGNKNNSINAD
jgi:hypothetical protein